MWAFSSYLRGFVPTLQLHVKTRAHLPDTHRLPSYYHLNWHNSKSLGNWTFSNCLILAASSFRATCFYQSPVHFPESDASPLLWPTNLAVLHRLAVFHLHFPTSWTATTPPRYGHPAHQWQLFNSSGICWRLSAADSITHSFALRVQSSGEIWNNFIFLTVYIPTRQTILSAQHHQEKLLVCQWNFFHKIWIIDKFYIIPL